MEERVYTITQIVVAVVCISVIGAISTIAACALFGPVIAPLMKYLPW